VGIVGAGGEISSPALSAMTATTTATRVHSRGGVGA
jgi:hypothetical protein